MSRCVVPTCNSCSRDRDNLREFHRFPREADLWRKWCRFVGKSFVPKLYSRICSDHFEPSAYTLMSQLLHLESRQKRLKCDAVPTLLGVSVTEPSNRAIRYKKRADHATVANLLEEQDTEATSDDRQRQVDCGTQTT